MVSIWANGGQLTRKPHFHVSFLMPAGSSRMRGFCSQTPAGWSVGWVGLVLPGCMPALGGLALRLGLQLWDTLVWLSPDRGRNQACSMREIHSGLVPGPTGLLWDSFNSESWMSRGVSRMCPDCLDGGSDMGSGSGRFREPPDCRGWRWQGQSTAWHSSLPCGRRVCVGRWGWWGTGPCRRLSLRKEPRHMLAIRVHCCGTNPLK